MFQNQHSTIPMKQFHLITLCLTVFLASLSLSASAQSSSATSTVLLRIEGTKAAMTGEVTQKGREGQHSVLAYSHEITAPRDSASGQATGKPQHQPFRVVKLINRSSPLLLQAIANGELLPTVTLDIWTPSSATGAEIKILTYVLKNARIVSVRPWMPNKHDTAAMNYGPAEEIAFTYESMSENFLNGATSGEAGWQ